MPPDTGHPRPQLRRDSHESLDGAWDFADDPHGQWQSPGDVVWDSQILVPFAPETPASGLASTGFRLACWYRRRVQTGPLPAGYRLLLHFGAVDYHAAVWVDGHPVHAHEGGYTGFSVDLTAYAGGTCELVVHARDDPAELAKPRGKQDWELEAHAIWYPRTTGIWQPVWLERIPRTSVAALSWSGDPASATLRLQAGLEGPLPSGLRLRVRLSHDGRQLLDDSIAVLGPVLERELALDPSGLARRREELTWSPDHPALIDAVLELTDAGERVLDRVESYAGLRSVGVRGGEFLLNGRPLELRLVLDQGYWPDSGLSAPDEAALRRDVELAKAMGFNGVRKHQKIEDPRYLYWADRLGLLVWEEMPAAYRFDAHAVRRLVTQWTAVVERDRSHPCIVAWVPFNESMGVPDLPGRAEQRAYVQGVALLTAALDPTRAVLANDGWEALGGDLVGVHDYDADPGRLRRRFDPAHLTQTLSGFRGNGRVNVLDAAAAGIGAGAPEAGASGRDEAGTPLGQRALVVSELGGIASAAADDPVLLGDPLTADPQDAAAPWGYSAAADGAELVRRLGELVEAVMSSGRVVGFCWTQFADTYQEVNGLLDAERRPKAALADIARAVLRLRRDAWPAPAPGALKRPGRPGHRSAR